MNTRKSLAESVGKSCQKLNPHIFGTLDPDTKQILNQTPIKAPKRIQQRSDDGMNKLERDALAWLKESQPAWEHRVKPMRLELANGCRYTPDIVSFPAISGGWKMKGVEVKGKMAWDDAIVKLKVAARCFPCMDWWLVWRDKGGWHMQHVLP